MNRVFSKMFLWMFLGLMVTFGVAYFLSQNDTMMYNLFSGKKYMIVWIAEIVVVMVLSLRIRKLSVMSARILFILYSLLTGVTVSTIFIVYSISSIIYVFLITSDEINTLDVVSANVLIATEGAVKAVEEALA